MVIILLRLLKYITSVFKTLHESEKHHIVHFRAISALLTTKNYILRANFSQYKWVGGNVAVMFINIGVATRGAKGARAPPKSCNAEANVYFAKPW